MRPDVQLYDLIKLVQGIVLIAEDAPERDELTERLLDLLVRGVRPGS